MDKSFPLYETLVNNKSKSSLTRIQKKELIEKIHSLDSNGHNKIIALIVYHQEVSKTRIKLPDLCSKLTIQISSLPEELLVILDMFCDRHIIYMKSNIND